MNFNKLKIMEKPKEIYIGLEHVFISPNELDRNMEPANVVDGLFAIARSISKVADSLNKLGLSSASTEMGAIELLSSEIKRIGDIMSDRDIGA